MAATAGLTSRLRFDTFELDLRSAELWKHGNRVRLQEQPFRVLRHLLEHCGEVVTREQLKQTLWQGDTFVEFDDGLNTAVRKLRDVLCDSADHPRYIETLPKRGYRFIAEVTEQADADPQADTEAPSSRRPVRLSLIGIAAATALLAASVWIYRAASAPGRPRIEAIAVLPLRNLSGDPSQQYFAAGLTDALTTELARSVGSSLRVTSRASADKYAGRPLSQTARELDVDAVIEGSVVRSGNRAHIQVQLIDARADKHLWAASYDCDLHDVLALQAEIAAIVARQVRITLEPRAQARLATAVSVDPRAYDLYQRGRYEAFSANPEEVSDAAAYLRQAVSLEPNLAPAHALLARLYSTQIFFVSPDDLDLDAKALEEVNEALKLDPDSPDAHLARGIIDWTHRNGFPHERAIREIKHAIELDPNLAEAHHELAKIFLHVGLLDKARQELQTALRLDPTNMGLRYRLAVVELDDGKPEQALAGFEGTRRFAPELWTYQMAFALFQVGRKQEAATLVRNYLQGNPRDEGGVANATQALLYADSGNFTLAEQSIETAIHNGRNFGHFHHASYTIGAAYALMNRRVDALRWLRAAADDGFPCYPLYASDPTLNSLRTDPNFIQFMADMKRRWQHYKAIA